MNSWIVACAVGMVLPFAVLARSAFEVASVKPNTTGNFGRLINYTADSLHATSVTLSSLIQSAYGIREDRLAGGPSWVRTTRFDVNAKVGQALPREQLHSLPMYHRSGPIYRRSSSRSKSSLGSHSSATHADRSST